MITKKSIYELELDLGNSALFIGAFDEQELRDRIFPQFMEMMRVVIPGIGGWKPAEVETLLSLPEETEEPDEPEMPNLEVKTYEERLTKRLTGRKEPEKDIMPYVRMHEAGEDIKAIKRKMIADGFCASGSSDWFAKKILKKSTNVISIKAESGDIDELIERLKVQNKETAEARKQPKNGGNY